jgi:ankyrin repeat protein
MNTYTSFTCSFRSRTLRIAAFLLAALAFTSPAFCGPIHDAAQKGDLNKVKALVQSDPKLVSSKDKNGNTPLHLAAFHDHAAVAEFLLASGANVNEKNSYASFVPDDLEGMFAANDANHKDPQDLLLAKGVDARASTNGYTALDLALFSYNHKDIVALLIAKGADVKAQAASGATPLFWAAMRGLKDDAQILIDKGADVNAVDAYQDSILDVAVRMNHPAVVELLLAKGADINAKDQRGFTPFYYAKAGDLDKIVDMLRKHGAHE